MEYDCFWKEIDALKCYYDLHIHSALSPCGDNDMTPNNIVNMAIIKGLDIISVTDHNSCGNVESVIKAAENKLLVIPGMEIESIEEVHICCYFPDIKACKEMWDIVKANMQGIKNKPQIFGNQYYMDENDNISGEEEELLVSATKLPFEKVIEFAKKCGGVAVPAHIDRSSYSVLSNLGFIPDIPDIKTVEITKKNREKYFDDYKQYNIITNSDAHYLWDIAEPEFSIDIMSKSDKDLIDFLCKM